METMQYQPIPQDNNSFPVVANGTIGKTEVQTVNARELHKFLEVGKVFANWIKDRIEQYDFTENQDYVLTFAKTGNRQNVKVTEYHLTLDMAKELCMVERNERGKQARSYFIECERRLKTLTPQIDYSDPAVMLGAFNHLRLENERKDGIILELENEVEALQPAQDALNRIAETDGSMCPTDTAKALQMRPKDLFAYMRSNGWTYQRPGARGDIAYQSKITSGLLVHKVTTILKPDGEEKTVYQVRVTPKGLTQLAKLINPAMRVIK